MRRSRWIALLLAAVSVGTTAVVAVASDETSSGDKLRILYSSRFSFTDNGFPLVTVEIMSGQRTIELSAPGGLDALPDGDGGASISGASAFSVTAKDTRAAEVREWTIVERFKQSELGDDDTAVGVAVERWRRKGYKPRTFETGTVFGVAGALIDSRYINVVISPVAAGRGQGTARKLAEKHQIITEVYTDLVRRPEGRIVARSGGTTIANPSVIWFKPRRPGATITVKNVVTGAGGSSQKISRKDRRFFGSVYVTMGRDGKLTVANAVPAGKLLEGLVPAEIFVDSPPAALEAQAIAARTILLEKIGTRHLADPYLLCSSQHCQVYAGAGREHPKTNRAVRKTRGQVLLRDSGGLVDARYSASCGGHGEHKHHIWGGEVDHSLDGHLDAAPGRMSKFARVTDNNVASFLADRSGDAFCSKSRFSKGRYRWTKTVSTAELTRRVNAKYPGTGQVRSLQPLSRGVSGRIDRLRVRGSRGSIEVRGDLHIRRLLGGLRSSLFTVTKADNGFKFVGAGFGHGVGMCQIGAIGRAESGHSASKILRHYYKRSKLQKLY